MLKWAVIFLWIAGLALHPTLMLSAIVIAALVGLVFRKPLATGNETRMKERKTADGRFPILNEDWVGEIVLAIDDAEVPEIIRRHGARFRNPARYVIELGNGEYALYGADGELLDLCYLRMLPTGEKKWTNSA